MAGRPKRKLAEKAAAETAEAKPSPEVPAVPPKYGILTEQQAIDLRALPVVEAIRFWDGLEAEGRKRGNITAVIRSLVLADLFYLLTRVCGRKDMLHPWVYGQVRMVEASPDDNLDLWSRGHFKSSIITFGLTIQDVLKDPDDTFGIFSHTRPIAKAFLRQIMRELESNVILHNAFPDVLWGKDTRAAPKWSEDDGIIVRRKSNPPEATIEAWGLVDGQPTSKHFRKLLYDDVVVEGSVTTPEMIEKTTKALEQSYNLTNEKFSRRFAGTRWHYNDSYRAVMDRGTAKPRKHPCTIDGTEFGTPVFWTEQAIADKRRDMGPYTFAAQCFPAGVKVLTSHWFEKDIADIVVGDYVIGYTFPGSDKSRLTPTKVQAIGSRIAKVVRFTFESGRTIDCTQDHKFFSGRRGKDVGGNDTHNAYAALGLGYKDLHAAIPVYDPRKLGCDDPLVAGWLSGLWDGEGSISHATINITQSPEHNPLVCERIENSLRILGFDYGVHNRPASKANNRNAKAGRQYFIKGGRQEKMRFLHVCQPANSWKIITSLNKASSRNFGKVMRDKLVSVEAIGENRVYSIQTATGNYVADGYAVKNCLLDPKADALQGFKREWLRYYKKVDSRNMNTYILVDAASEKKKGSDYTAMWVIGLNTDGNYYALDIIRDRLNLTERSARLFELHRRYRECSHLQQVRYEKYGLMADVEHIKTQQEALNYRFDIVEVAGQTPKRDRIGRLIPIFEQGKFYLPESLHKTDYQKVPRDLVHSFVEEEYAPFPVGLHDDMFDGLARIAEPDHKLVWPQADAAPRGHRIFNEMGEMAWMA